MEQAALRRLPLQRVLPWLQRRGGKLFPFFAFASLVSALLVVSLGGVVRVTGSGLGCPDWPLCHGRLIPPPDVKAWIEYLHRLSASLASAFTILMVLGGVARFGFRRELLLPVAAPVLLLAQVVLGAFTVLREIDPAVAVAHTAVAMAFVGCLALIVSGVVPWSAATAGSTRAPVRRTPGEGAYRTATLALALGTYGLLLTGAFVYRSGASLACLGFPLCDTPPDAAGGSGLQGIHMLHRWSALAVTLVTAYTLWAAWRLQPRARPLFGLTGMVASLLALQIALGAGSVVFRVPDWARLGHLIIASLLFTGTVLLAGSVWRRSRA